MSELETRWKRRFANFGRAVARLRAAVALAHERPLSELEQQGLIQAFEFTHELVWKVMRDYLALQGNPDISGSRDATRAAFAGGLIKDGEVWMEMIASRNQTSHTYNQDIADAIATMIVDRYAPLFEAFRLEMSLRSHEP
jgi:nucleotidyltransferase substrate binding protein (TIGR01987 family)